MPDYVCIGLVGIGGFNSCGGEAEFSLFFFSVKPAKYH